MELRLYSFVNFYLSSIQQGIQTGHCAVDLVRKYTPWPLNKYDEARAKQEQLVADWADNHKTFIILNGGDLDGVIEARKIIMQAEVPWESFYESQGALGGMLTCVACVLPETIFNARPTAVAGPQIYAHQADNEDTPIIYNPGHQYYDLITLLRSSRLAS